MNIRAVHRSARPHTRHHERGMAVIVVVAILAILLIYVAGNLRTLHLLTRDLKQIEQKQLLRLRVTIPMTNAVAVTNAAWPTNQTR